MDLPEQELVVLRRAAQFHDIVGQTEFIVHIQGGYVPHHDFLDLHGLSAHF